MSHFFTESFLIPTTYVAAFLRTAIKVFEPSINNIKLICQTLRKKGDTRDAKYTFPRHRQSVEIFSAVVARVLMKINIFSIVQTARKATALSHRLSRTLATFI